MAIFSSEVEAIGQADLVSSATPACKVGTRVVSDDGRVFRYVKAAAAADLVAGNVIQGPPTIVDHLATTATATVAGALSLTFTPAATGAAAGYYDDGVLSVDTGPGNGYTYSVNHNPTITASVACTITLKDPIQVALSTASRLGLSPNPWNGVIQFPATTATGPVVGVATYIIAASQYGWVQTWGRCSVLIVGTPALGAAVMAPSSSAGGAIILTTTNLIVAQYVGYMAQIGVSGKNNLVDLKINP
jgi:hypothetical protein